MMGDSIFALDIGTRKVIGLIMKKTATGFEVLDAELIEHSTRAMLDGQIHDVEAVADVIIEIKRRLEERQGITLETAAVAAAGRALKTARGIAEVFDEGATEMGRNQCLALEIEAVQQAQIKLAREEQGKDQDNYFCVGYSVICYRLEGQEIGNLVGQVGEKKSVEVIATFLPRVVVDSLFSALKRAGLDVHSMTLEPIAAMSIAVPPNMRILNLALVDIGAGTSDIAIVKDGNVFAYAMVPIGGDELTEQIAREYLMDFSDAEEVKCSLDNQEIVKMTDILGNEIEASSSEIVNGLEPVIRQLVLEVSSHIMVLNGKAPDAVICVGGGSLTPGLPRTLAESMELPYNRVGLRTNKTAKRVSTSIDFLNGAQGITPLGIAYTSIEKEPLPLFKVNVNGRELAIWNAGAMDVGKALLSAGIALNHIFGRPGLGKAIEINGEVKFYKGDMGSQPVITINGQEAAFDSPVYTGNRIDFEKGQDGKDASVKVRDLVSGKSGFVTLNGKRVEIKQTILINGEIANRSLEIPDRAKVEIRHPRIIKELLKENDIDELWLESSYYRFYINEEEKRLEWAPVNIKVNGQAAGLNDEIQMDSVIECEIRRDMPLIRDVIGPDLAMISLRVNVNGQDCELPGYTCRITADSRPVQSSDPLQSGMRLQVDKIIQSAILSDVFKVIDFKARSNGKLVMTVNGEAAGFTTPVFENSVIELRWD